MNSKSNPSPDAAEILAGQLVESLLASLKPPWNTLRGELPMEAMRDFAAANPPGVYDTAARLAAVLGKSPLPPAGTDDATDAIAMVVVESLDIGGWRLEEREGTYWFVKTQEEARGVEGER